MSALETLLLFKIVAIVRGAKPEHLREIAAALASGGIRAIEITLNSPDALAGIKDLAANNNDLLVGAGTVLHAEDAVSAIDAGAQFIISPCLDENVIASTRAHGAVSIPGAYTATEIVRAYNVGADLVKVFPCSDPKYIRDIRAPLSHIPLMPTGGINSSNIAEFRAAGAVAFGVGSALVNTTLPVNDIYLLQLESNAASLIKALAV